MRVCPHKIGFEIEAFADENPNDIWPSTSWEQVTDGRVTLASSSAHALGSTGGSETHTLTVDEMPSHTHTQNAHNHTQNAHSHTVNGGGGASITGGSHTHGWNNNNNSMVGEGGGTHGSVNISGGGYAHKTMQAATHTHSLPAHTHSCNSQTPGINNTTATNQNTGGGRLTASCSRGVRLIVGDGWRRAA